MRRRFRTCIAVSLILFATTLVLWPVSRYRGLGGGQSRPFGPQDRAPAGVGWLEVNHGVLRWEHIAKCQIDRLALGWGDVSASQVLFGSTYDARGPEWFLSFDHSPPPQLGFEFPSRLLGFTWSTEQKFTSRDFGFARGPDVTTLVTYRTVSVPLWFLALIFAIAPAIAARRWYRHRRWRGHDGQAVPCPKCGYDLRGRPEVNNCPECGAAVAKGVTR